MKSPSASEIILLARVLTCTREADRRGKAMAILSETDEAERHRRLTGRLHPFYGDGSLMARCYRLDPPSEPFADDRDFLACLALAAISILDHQQP